MTAVAVHPDVQGLSQYAIRIGLVWNITNNTLCAKK